MRYVVRLPVSKRYPMILEFFGSEWAARPASPEITEWFRENPGAEHTQRAVAHRNPDGSFHLESSWTYEFVDEAKATEFRKKFLVLE